MGVEPRFELEPGIHASTPARYQTVTLDRFAGAANPKHHVRSWSKPLIIQSLVRPRGFEPATFRSGGNWFIQLCPLLSTASPSGCQLLANFLVFSML
jgi:hypothetical protein